MIDQEKAKAIWIFYKSGMADNEISKRLSMDPKTVKKIIDNGGHNERKTRKDKKDFDDELIMKTFKECSGWGARTQEVLKSKGMEIGYSTLMKRINELGLKQKNKKDFSHPVDDVPGSESQHDLSDYYIKIGEKKTKMIASLFYLRFSKLFFLKFYPFFDRFKMKCFFFEALSHFQHMTEICVIDNTSLVINRGSGKNAVFNKEMVDFAKAYGFKWYAHAIKHSDRKAGVERGFFTITQNFLPGRFFSSIEDLNTQAFNWCVERSQKITKQKFIPMDRFEYEKSFMKKVVYAMPPYRQFPNRIVDQEGYIVFNTNLYWVGIQKHLNVSVLEYPGTLQIFHARKFVREYKLPPFGTREKKFTPEGVTIPYRPKKKTVPPNDEEKELRQGSSTSEYLDFVLKPLGPQGRYQLIRKVYHLYKTLTPHYFNETINRALRFKVRDKNKLEKIAHYLTCSDGFDLSDFEEAELADAYSKEPDLKTYDQIVEKKDEPESED
jgi:hypothetical protein